jgi:hypothetical protein
MSYGAVVFGAMECRRFCAFNSRKAHAYWRSEDRGENRFPDPSCKVNGHTEVWDINSVARWAEQTRERRGLVWTKHGLRKPEATEPEAA